MDYEAFKALVREMRTAQKEYFAAAKLPKTPESNRFTLMMDALQRSKALEKRVDDELAQKVETDPNVIIMKNGQKLVQGSLF